MHRRLGSMAAALALALSSVPAYTQGTGPRAFVLDQAARSVTAIDLATGRAQETATLEGSPSVLLRTADGRRLLVLDKGEGRDAGDAGFQAKTRSALTILDGRSLAPRARIELGWGLDDTPMLSLSGDRLSVVCPGYRGKTPAESLTREILTVDLDAGKVLSRVALSRPASAYFATPDGRTGVVLSNREEPRKAPPVSAQLLLVDLTAGAVLATVPLEGNPGDPVLAPDGQFVYLLDRGKPNNNPDRNINGRLHVVSLTTRAVHTLADAGSRPRGLVLDERGGQLFMLSDGTPVKGPANKDRPGELRVIRGAAAAAPIPVVSSPERLEESEDGRTLNVLGDMGLTRVSLPGLVPSALVQAPGVGRPDNESALSADGRRAFVLFAGEYLTTYDLENGVKLASVRTGRMGKKMLLALESGLMTETGRLNARNDARKAGRSYYSYTEYTVRAPRGTMTIRPDGKALYALNSQTSDTTVVDADTGQVLEKVAAGGFAVRFMPAASVALVVSSSSVRAVDLASHEKLADVVTDSPGNFDRAELAPDARVAVISGSGGVLVVHASSGKPVGTLMSFRNVVDVAIDWRQAGGR